MVRPEVSIDDENTVEAVLGKAIEVSSIQRGSRVLSDLMRARGYRNVVASCVTVQGVERTGTLRTLVMKALRQMAREDDASVSAFREAIEKVSREHLETEKQQYTVVLPLNVRREDFGNQRWFNVAGTQLRIWSWSHARRKVDIEAWRTEQQKHSDWCRSPFNEDFTPLASHVEERKPRTAFYPAEEAYDVFRSLLNMSFVFRQQHIPHFGMRYRLGRIVPAPIYGIFNSDGAYAGFFYDADPPKGYPTPVVRREQFEYVREYLKGFAGGAPTEVEQLMINAIGYYGRALDTTNWRQAFLSLWQIIEMLTSGTGGRRTQKNVVRRAKILLRGKAFLEGLLDVACQTRNRLVHEGRFPRQDAFEDVCMLKMVVEECIEAVSSLTDCFSTWHELNRFYTYARTAPAERRAIMQAIKHIDRWEAR